MTPVTESALVDHRTEALAMVVLTRRPDVLPTRIDVGGLDLFAKILSAADSGKVEDPGIGFGVVFAGTSKPLSTESEATAFANRKFKATTLRQFTFFFPVISLFFSMHDDAAWYSWIAMPSLDKGEPRLHRPSPLKCHRFDHAALNDVVDTSRAWFDSLVEMIVR